MLDLWLNEYPKLQSKLMIVRFSYWPDVVWIEDELPKAYLHGLIVILIIYSANNIVLASVSFHQAYFLSSGMCTYGKKPLLFQFQKVIRTH